MIYCTNEIRAKVWRAGVYNGRLLISITTYEKDKKGNYINSSWFARCLSASKETLKDVKKGDNIIIKRCALRNTYNKQKDKEYFGFDIYEAEIKDTAERYEEREQSDTEKEETEDDLPF